MLWSGKVAGTRHGGRYADNAFTASCNPKNPCGRDSFDGECDALQRRHTCSFHFAFVNSDGVESVDIVPDCSELGTWELVTIKLCVSSSFLRCFTHK